MTYFINLRILIELIKYYVKINGENFAFATVLDPRYKVDVNDFTQDPCISRPKLININQNTLS